MSLEERIDELKLPGIRPFDMGRGPMKNWLMASGEAIAQDKDLQQLLESGYYFALSLPPKKDQEVKI